MSNAAKEGRPKPKAGELLFPFWKVEPWPEPVDGAMLLNELAGIYAKHVILPQRCSDAMALWTLHTWTLDTAMVSPLLVFSSPERQCGKTTALDVLRLTVRRPLPAVNVTAASVFRVIEEYGPTLLIDEADSLFRERDDLRSVVNAGHTRGMAQVIRCVGDDHKARVFSVWAPKAIALIGELPATIVDRSIIVAMRRKLRRQRVVRLRAGEDFVGDVRRRAARWTLDNERALRNIDPGTGPKGLNDRAADNWRHLMTIAERCGGGWPERAQRAAVTLSGDSAVGETSPKTLLLSDVRELFAELGPRISSANLVERLQEMENRPWPEYRGGEPITPRQIAQLLRPFGIMPKSVRIDEETPKGYAREDFEDAFSRYLPAGSATAPRRASRKARSDRSSRNAGRNGSPARDDDKNRSTRRSKSVAATVAVEGARKRARRASSGGVAGRAGRRPLQGRAREETAR